MFNHKKLRLEKYYNRRSLKTNVSIIQSRIVPFLLLFPIGGIPAESLTNFIPSGLSKLLTLELEDNHFHDGNVSPLTFRPLRKLAYLRLDDNRFRGVPSGLPVSLQVRPTRRSALQTTL